MESDSDEDFVSYGTPLEPLEEDEPLRKPIPIHEQTVKDEKGRYQRFHGAFTGGFSAGYFNTVGSKEGWTPSTFVSSRQQKGESSHARPEDFMDEEDFGEHGIAPAQITTSWEFSSGRTDAVREKARAVNAQAAIIPGATLLEELITPARSSIGVELLRKMGWKEGQGVGPRVKRKVRSQRTGDDTKVYGCALPPAGSEESENEDDEEFGPENVTFAPKDMTPVDFLPKEGVKGLGYRGLDPGLALLHGGAAEHIDLFKPESDTRSRLFGNAQKTSRRGGVCGQAFGVGALEDDDEDVYHKDTMSKYDTELGGEEPGDGLYGWTAPQQYTKKSVKNKDVSYLGKILEGFTVAQKAAEDKMIFPPPVLPPDFRPVHGFRKSLSAISSPSPALTHALSTSRGHMVKEEPKQEGRHQLDSSQRGALLGEQALHGLGSVMELLRPEDKQRLLSVRNNSVTAATSCTGGMKAESATALLVQPSPQGSAVSTSNLQQDALASWRGVQSSTQTFKPFEKNTTKQARYELYLNRLKQGDKDALEQSLDSGMTEWERSRERDEFVRASILYRPTSTSLSSRFTRAKHQEDDSVVEVARDEEGDVDDKQAAVKMKMFGKMTRETFEWHPDKLLCKRFNVPDPYKGSGVVGLLKVKRDKFSVFNFLTVAESRETTVPVKPPEEKKKSRWDVSGRTERSEEEGNNRSTKQNQTETKAPSKPAAPASPPRLSDQTLDQKDKTNGESEKLKEEEEEEEEEEQERPPMDLFKAIFASSDDSSSSSDGEDEAEETNEGEGNLDPQQPFNLFTISSDITSSSTLPTSSSITSSSAPISSSVTPSSSSAPTTSSSVTSKQTAVFSQTSMQDEFGPKLPPHMGTINREGAASFSSSGTEEKQRKKSKEKKHKNKEHKHKKEKKKKKEKKQKHKEKHQKRSKEDSEGQSSTQELLKRLKNVPSHLTW